MKLFVPGDYVDRGKQSIESICLLLSYKAKYPENFFLIRGTQAIQSLHQIANWNYVLKKNHSEIAI